MKMTRVVTAGAVACSVAFAPVVAAQADQSRTCGWSGNVKPLLAKADNQVRKVDVAAKAEPYFGPGVVVTSYTRVEADLQAAVGAATQPTDPRTLTDNRVSYNLSLEKADGTPIAASIQMRYDGLCRRTAVFRPEAWVGSTGVRKPIRVGAHKALTFAQSYRRDHAAQYPLTQPLVSMNLMQATTAPPDFGKLRWYVNYDNGQGGLAILAVYMDGTVAAIG